MLLKCNAVKNVWLQFKWWNHKKRGGKTNKKKKNLKSSRWNKHITKKGAGLQNENKKSLSDISVPSVKQSFLGAPRGRHQMRNSSPLLELTKTKKKKHWFVMLWTQCQGLSDPLGVFSRFKLKKVDYGLCSSSKFIPVRNRIQTLEHTQKQSRDARNSHKPCCRANAVTRDDHVQCVRIKGRHKSQQLFLLLSTRKEDKKNRRVRVG